SIGLSPEDCDSSNLQKPSPRVGHRATGGCGREQKVEALTSSGTELCPWTCRPKEYFEGHWEAAFALESALTMSPAVLSDLGYVPPDGGWGWAVVFGASISIGFAFTFPKAFTIYFREIQAVFSISYSQIAWTTSIMCATTYGGEHRKQVLKQLNAGILTAQ
ncbi:hypothetical protein DV515_00009588, partial [Chloebia gouldiae]